MGEGSFVNMSVPPVEKNHARPVQPRSMHLGIDWLLVGAVVGLVLFGMLMVYSAGPKFAMQLQLSPDYFLQRQIMWAGVGGVVAIGLTFLNYHFFRRITILMLLGTLAALLAVALIGNTTLGANRSLFSGSIRPSELAKLVIIIYVSVWLNAKQDVLNDITFGLVPLIIILGTTAGLIMVQPDFSAAITVAILGSILFFLAGGEWRQIALVMLVTALFGWLVVNIYPTGIRRINEYLTGLHDPLQASFHVQRSLEAVINGGLFGTGIGLGRAKFTGLPVAPTDSIFAVIAEEVGLLGAAMVVLAYLVILWRGLFIAERAQDKLGSLLASGITVWILVEALLNMAVMVNLLPQAGNALPFISYGGSNMVVTLAGVGILMNIARTSEKKELARREFLWYGC